jgi:AraC-like DNA-binding protein
VGSDTQPYFPTSYIQKPLKSQQIPLLNPQAGINHDFSATADWKPFLANDFSVFHINRIEKYREFLKFPIAPHRKTVFDFIFLTNGSTIRSKGLDLYEVTTKQFFFLPAYQITNNAMMSTDIEGFFCHFDTDLFQKNFVTQKIDKEFSFLKFLGNPIVSIDDQAQQPILNILERLENEYENHRPHKLELISFYLLTLFTELKRYTHTAEKITENTASRITESYKNALTQFVYEKQHVADYAQLLSISPNHLNKCVKSTTGKSAHDLLEEMILLEAKVLLKQTSLNISEIAYKVGKQDPSNFGRFFKTKTGLTPKEYKLLE